MSLPNPARQQAARAKLKEVFAQPRAVFAIHYACESFYASHGASQRIVAIVVRPFDSGQITSFAIEKIAEARGIFPAHIALHRGALERELLATFAAFVARQSDARFVHWNMRDNQFGFSALQHRARIVGAASHTIAERDRVDLAQLLLDVYGDAYVSDRAKLEALARLNGLATSDFLRGGEEAQAVRDGRWRDVHASTRTKVRLIAEIARKAHEKTLTTEASVVARFGGPVRLVWDQIRANPMISVVSGLCSAIGFGWVLAARLMT